VSQTASGDAAKGVTPFAIRPSIPTMRGRRRAAERQRTAASASQREAETRFAFDFVERPRNWRYGPGVAGDRIGRGQRQRPACADAFPSNASVPAICAIATDGYETMTPRRRPARVQARPATSCRRRRQHHRPAAAMAADLPASAAAGRAWTNPRMRGVRHC